MRPSNPSQQGIYLEGLPSAAVNIWSSPWVTYMLRWSKTWKLYKNPTAGCRMPQQLNPSSDHNHRTQAIFAHSLPHGIPSAVVMAWQIFQLSVLHRICWTSSLEGLLLWGHLAAFCMWPLSIFRGCRSWRESVGNSWRVFARTIFFRSLCRSFETATQCSFEYLYPPSRRLHSRDIWMHKAYGRVDPSIRTI